MSPEFRPIKSMAEENETLEPEEKLHFLYMTELDEIKEVEE